MILGRARSNVTFPALHVNAVCFALDTTPFFLVVVVVVVWGLRTEDVINTEGHRLSTG